MMEYEPNIISLRAGAIEMFLETDTGFLRRIRLGDREVIRCIYAAVRDHNWATPLPRISILSKTIGTDSFAITFESECQENDLHFCWKTSITGNSNGIVTVTFDGEALATFRRNRIGLCVLHPIRECAGATARQTRTDGSVIECRFPMQIEPQLIGRASFRDLRQLAHEVRPRLWAELSFDGEVFEMEDQRNWTDASFKTYGTPLADPFPVEVQKGTQIHQSVRLRFHPHQLGAPISVCEPEIIRVPAAPNARLPQLGMCLGKGELAECFELPKLAHLRVDLHLATPHWREDLRRAAHAALPLELALHLPSGDLGTATAVNEVAKFCADLGVHLARILALRKGEPATGKATYETIKASFTDTSVGAGSDCNFCEVNRERVLGNLPPNPNFLFWSIAAQVHATDSLSVMETLEAQGETVRSAAAFASKAPCVASPITLTQRFNPVATEEDGLPPCLDPRLSTLYGAAWTLGSIASLAQAGLTSATYFDSGTLQGLVGHIFKALVGHEAASISIAHGQLPYAAIGLPDRILVSNLSQDQTTLKLAIPRTPIEISELEPSGTWRSEPIPQTSELIVWLKLAPYGVAQIVCP